MKKALFAALAAVLVTAVPVTAFASDFDFNSGRIEKYNGTEENVVIPDSIDGEAVTSVGSSAFCGNGYVKTVSIPSTVTQIWQNNMADYGTYPFLDTPNLESITVDENNSCYMSADGVLFDKTNNELLFYPQNKSGDSYTVPQNVASVRKFAFYKCNSLKAVRFTNDSVVFNALSFGYDNDITFYCHKDSTADSYAAQNGFKVVYTDTEKGDVNADGTITAADAAELLTHCLNSGYALSVETQSADMDGNGKLTANDASLILQSALGA